MSRCVWDLSSAQWFSWHLFSFLSTAMHGERAKTIKDLRHRYLANQFVKSHQSHATILKKGRQAPKVNRDLTERKNHGIYENPGHLAGAAVYSESRFCYVIPISPQLLSCKLYLLGSYCLKWYVYF